jgi:hypothetical protein
MRRAAPRRYREAVLQAGLRVDQKRRSQTKVETRKAIGKGMSIGWRGCPAICAVVFGFLAIGETPVLCSYFG